MRRQIWENYTKVLPEETFRIWGVILFATQFNFIRFWIRHFTIIIGCCRRDSKQLTRQVGCMMKMRSTRTC
jgi:hypothetical protein